MAGNPFIKGAVSSPVSVGSLKKDITGGSCIHAERKLSNREKAWGKLAVTVPGNYVFQVQLPDGTVHELATVEAVIPSDHVARLDARIYVNVVKGRDKTVKLDLNPDPVEEKS